MTALAIQRLETIVARLQANADEWHTRASEQQRAGGKGGLAAEYAMARYAARDGAAGPAA